ncbi:MULTISPECIES: S8 family serine peptidase [unclassified Lysobacter]|uniref:S8 family serine peptidase n=1 Tax=unclassified Lysobacter TaxID=2635362 RepID=UPI001BEA4C85|nr:MULTISPECIES: S8 family serine peptidase [unclassified Lysobacter]MBT2746650.1 S8 family serine peptidase [Lysobacter sp. ISL-42]MBT2753355.1 S8 family serine peptidase [Lysobacter sp. ISL-50]MBT2775465.1 S8 family serine peptidase [Lysobacter sp. ISL-54]MBT2782999.1 S8 family serine peptidase [Lysobacter sp. ISL-52]
MNRRRIPLTALAVALAVTPLLSLAQAAPTAPASGFELDLGGLRFDPLKSKPVQATSAWGRARADGEDWRLVQFKGPVQQAWLDELRRAGLEPVQYLHPYTYIAWGKRDALNRLAGQSEVRWSGDFLPAYRVQPELRKAATGPVQVSVISHRGSAEVGASLSKIGVADVGAGNKILDRSLQTQTVRIPADQIAALAQTPGVYSVQTVPTDGGLRGEMSSQINAGNVNASNLAVPGYLSYLSGLGVNGTGAIIANVDGGIYHTHPDLVARMTTCTGTTCGGSASSAHGTHTAAIMAGDGASNARATASTGSFLRGLGVAPGAKLVEQVYSPTYTQAGGMLALMTQSVRNRATISGNSWGPSGTPRGYDGDTRQVDVGVRDADPNAPGDQPLNYVLSFMNGNGGTQSQGSPDEAKNTFTIGSTKGQTSATVQIAAINDLSSNTAHGPARDGRRIPGMVAPGCSIDSANSASGHGLMCGTSMASPQVAGASALFTQYYRARAGVDPSPALTRAAFTAVAQNLVGKLDADGVVLTTAPDAKQGWGRMLIEPVLRPAQTVQYIDQSHVFNSSGESWTRTFTAADPGKPVRIMLVWTDAPGHGLGGTTPAWNNNLDLRVTAGGSTYLGNVFAASGWSATGGAADARNNNEGVFLQSAQHGGSVSIVVRATDINSNGLPNSGDDTDQDFALVCYNCAASL